MKKTNHSTRTISGGFCLSKTAAILAALLAFARPSRGLGVRIPDQDAFATGRGEAFAATADNPSAIYYNPAGITQLEGLNYRGGYYAIGIYDHMYSSAGAAHTVDSIQGVPQLYLTYSISNTPLSAGLGMYSPYGLAMQWPQNTSFDTLGVKGSIQYLCFNPIIAWQIISNLSVAAGPTINYAKTDLQFSAYPPNAGVPGTQVRFKGGDNTPGFTLGIMYKPLPEVSLGASYRSQTIMGFRGPASVNGAGLIGIPDHSNGAEAEFTFPQNVVGGISYRPTENWNVEFDVDWTQWSRLKTVSVNSSPLYYGGSHLPLSLPFNWQDSFFFEWGVTRYFGHDWHASAGYIYSENSVPDNTFNPLVPDSDRHIWSVGLGHKYKNFSWDATYQLAWGPPRTINSGPTSPTTGQNNHGTYEFISHAIIISIGYHF